MCAPTTPILLNEMTFQWFWVPVSVLDCHVPEKQPRKFENLLPSNLTKLPMVVQSRISILQIIIANDIDSSVCLSTQQTAHPSINSLTVLDSDFVRVSASESVPQTILASQDNGEIEQEIVDLNAVANSVSAELTVVEATSVPAELNLGKSNFYFKILLQEGWLWLAPT